LTDDKKNVIDVRNIDHYDINHTLEIMLQADYGSHYIIVYPDLSTLRRIYSNYSKIQLENKNDIVLLLPFYETTESVRKILSGGFHDVISSLDIGKNEKDGSLVIVDSKKAYFGSKTIVDIKTFVGMLIEHAKHSQKTGVCVIADMGAFFYLNKIQELVKYETTLPPKFDLNLKAFCCYHESDFSNYLIGEQDHNLLHHHGKAMIMNTTSSN
jgi:MEDS: MEthanogen/methylotroph, DcmR Sensory domain